MERYRHTFCGCAPEASAVQDCHNLLLQRMAPLSYGAVLVFYRCKLNGAFLTVDLIRDGLPGLAAIGSLQHIIFIQCPTIGGIRHTDLRKGEYRQDSYVAV